MMIVGIICATICLGLLGYPCPTLRALVAPDHAETDGGQG